jgi:uroporphyrinogen-III synthase
VSSLFVYVALHNIDVNCPALAIGERKTLTELKEMALTDPDMQSMTKEDEQALIDALKEHREEKKRSARPNNKSAAQDILSTMDRVTDEVRRVEWPCFTHRAHTSTARLPFRTYRLE